MSAAKTAAEELARREAEERAQHEAEERAAIKAAVAELRAAIEGPVTHAAVVRVEVALQAAHRVRGSRWSCSQPE